MVLSISRHRPSAQGAPLQGLILSADEEHYVVPVRHVKHHGFPILHQCPDTLSPTTSHRPKCEPFPGGTSPVTCNGAPDRIDRDNNATFSVRGYLLIGSRSRKSFSRNSLNFFQENWERLHEIVRLFLRTGYRKFAGYLVGGMTAWNNVGLLLESVGQMTVNEVKGTGKRLQKLGVRAPDEWKNGHIPNARHVFLGELRERLDKPDRTKTTAVYCSSGYRVSIATSILQQAGFGCVSNIPGSRQAWEEAGFLLEGNQNKETK